MFCNKTSGSGGRTAEKGAGTGIFSFARTCSCFERSTYNRWGAHSKHACQAYLEDRADRKTGQQEATGGVTGGREATKRVARNSDRNRNSPPADAPAPPPSVEQDAGAGYFAASLGSTSTSSLPNWVSSTRCTAAAANHPSASDSLPGLEESTPLEADLETPFTTPPPPPPPPPPPSTECKEAEVSTEPEAPPPPQDTTATTTTSTTPSTTREYASPPSPPPFAFFVDDA